MHSDLVELSPDEIHKIAHYLKQLKQSPYILWDTVAIGILDKRQVYVRWKEYQGETHPRVPCSEFILDMIPGMANEP